MTRNENARPKAWPAGGRAVRNGMRNHEVVSLYPDPPSYEGITNLQDRQPAVLTVSKRGRLCHVGKLVVAHPLDEMVFAQVYRHRRPVKECVSVAPAVLAYARRYGVRLWVLRFDKVGECRAFPLADIERRGFPQSSDGQPEFFVPLSAFDTIAWQTWSYVERTVEVGGRPVASQLSFLERRAP